MRSLRMGIFLPIRSVVISCITLVTGCAADPVTSDLTQTDTKVALLTEHGPVYPSDMEKLGKTGSVFLDCTITRTGQARDCTITKATNQEFAAAAQAYIAGAQYRPATRAGIPVSVAHHTININFKISFKPLRIVYDCSITPAGQAKDCRSENFATTIPPVISDIVLSKLESLPMAAGEPPRRIVEEPRRAIEVLLMFQEDPRLGFMAPSMPVRTQVNLLLACSREAQPRCKEIPELPFSTELQPYENDRFAALSISFNPVPPIPMTN